MKAPIERLVKRLSNKEFGFAQGEPLAKGLWTALDPDQIIRLYSAVNRGLQNYYRFVDNWKHLSRIQYISNSPGKDAGTEIQTLGGKDLSTLWKGPLRTY